MDYGRMPRPFPLETLTGGAQEAAAAVVAAARQQVKDASYVYRGDKGDYMLFSGESVSFGAGSAAATLEICREGGDLITEYGDPINSVYYGLDHDRRLPVGVHHHGTELLGGHASRVARAARDIGRGALAGEHARAAVRLLDRSEDKVPMMLQATIACGGNGKEWPLTTVALSLVRPYNERVDDDTQDMLAQQYDVVYDPNTGLYAAGSAFNSTPGALPVEEVQQMFRPDLPVDRHLTPQEWTALVQRPLNPADLLQL